MHLFNDSLIDVTGVSIGCRWRLVLGAAVAVAHAHF